ncbi:MAG TPA: hypothetical protein VE780_12275 [Thermoleophilaceae bacterium]|nr:hypothetical protein [Thermoleophilaceae bacterium]
MHRRPHRRPSPAIVIALIALFVALTGSAYAALRLPRNSVGSAQLRRGAVTKAKLRTNAVTSSKVKDHSLGAKDLRRGLLSAGVSNVVTRYGPIETVDTGAGLASFAACHAGEVATGGGWAFPNGDPANPNYFIDENGPGVVGAPANDGAQANGWLITITDDTGSSFDFQSYAMCASP